MESLISKYNLIHENNKHSMKIGSRGGLIGMIHVQNIFPFER